MFGVMTAILLLAVTCISYALLLTAQHLRL